MNIILASSSPRRKELLGKITDSFEVKPSAFDENKIKFDGDCEEFVKKLSFNKARDIVDEAEKDSLIIGADTIVSLDGKVLGKPKDEEEAFNMIHLLSGRTHKVYSGITVIRTSDMAFLSDAVCTSITFSKLTDNEIKEYVNTGEPMDKAGAYGIQGLGGVFVEKVEGCYYNVVGLPLNRLKKLMLELGFVK